MFNVTSERLTQFGSRPRAQSTLSVNKTSQWLLACEICFVHPAPQHGYERKTRAVAHSAFCFGAEPFRANLRECLQTATVLVLRCVSGVAVQCCCFPSDGILFCDLPWALQHFFWRSNSERAILKEQSKSAPWATLRLFKDGVPLACLWMGLLPGSIWWSRTLCLVLGLSGCWSSARGWVMFSLWQYDHRNVAIQRPPHQIRECPPCHSPF